jgi:hypothetical protein
MQLINSLAIEPVSSASLTLKPQMVIILIQFNAFHILRNYFINNHLYSNDFHLRQPNWHSFPRQSYTQNIIG